MGGRVVRGHEENGRVEGVSQGDLATADPAFFSYLSDRIRTHKTVHRPDWEDNLIIFLLRILREI